MEAFDNTLLDYVHENIRELKTESPEMQLYFITFLKDALDYYNL